MKTFLYTATAPNGTFLGTGVVEAEDQYAAFDYARSLYGIQAEITIREDEEKRDPFVTLHEDPFEVTQ